LVSAKAETKNLLLMGNKGLAYQTPSWARTISVKFPEPAHIKTETTMNPIETSYETIWAADRKAPKKAYFEFEAHPAIMIPYTAKEEIANLYKIPLFLSAYTYPSEIGSAAHPLKARTKVKIGALLNKAEFAAMGTMVSFNKSFLPSAKGVKTPYLPTAFGPRRR